MSNMEQRLGPGMLYEGPSLEPGIVRTYPDGVMWLIKPDGTRCIIPCAGGGGGGAPVNAEYVVLALDATLTAERVLTPGDALSLTDGGAGGNVTLDVLVDGITIQVNGGNQLEVISAGPTGPAGGVLDGAYPNPGLAASVAGDGLSELVNVLNVNVGDALAIVADIIDVQVDGTTIQVNGLNQLEVIGGSAAPTNASYVVMGLNATLTDERVLTAGDALALTDGGANGPATLDVLVDGVSIGFNGSNQIEVIGGALTNAVIKNPGSSTRNLIIPTGDFINLPIQASVGQTADLTQWQSSVPAVLLAIQADGDMAWAANEFTLGRTGPNMLALTGATHAFVGGGTSRVLTLTITGSPTGGTFTITAGSSGTTGPLNFNASAADVQTALRVLSQIYPAGVVTAGGPLPGTPITITFQQQLGGQQTNFTPTTTDSLTGGTAPASSITQTTAPVPLLSTVGTTYMNQFGVYLPFGSAVKLGNVAQTSWVAALFREQNNFIVLRAGDGQNMVVGDTNGTIGIGRGMTQPQTLTPVVGGIAFQNTTPVTGVTNLRIVSGAAQGTSNMFEVFLAGTGAQLAIQPTGEVRWGTAGDVNLYRGAANQLKTDDDWAVGANSIMSAAGVLTFGGDTNLFRSAANVLKTDDDLTVGANTIIDADGFIEVTEISAPATPAANKIRLFAVDDGAGNTQLAAKFPSGNTVILAVDFA